ncbi:MAG TPA: type II toxin-antitoxin system VapC family toxin [Anaerolineales bacterium]|jgi:predicted nucleic acid-binding protein|nr:type II toxin-antitoxin system VapC family toxin [Anaerolineales bacterium]
MIIDANVILRAFFPDEAQEKAQAVIRDHVAERVKLKAPGLLPYELSNAVWQAERRDRISQDQADQIISSMEGLLVEIQPLEWGEMLPMARRFERSAYDAAYLTLAQKLGEQLLTGDKRLYNAVREHLDWVVWIENYDSQE